MANLLVRGNIVTPEGVLMDGALAIMTAERDGQRLHTFPDLLVTLSVETGRAVSAHDLHEGQDVAVLAVPKRQLPLGAGMWDRSVYRGRRVVRDVAPDACRL